MSQGEVIGMLIGIWVLFFLIVVLYGDDRPKSFLYPYKKKGERGIVTLCRGAFILAFTPLILIALFGIMTAKAAPNALTDLWIWLIEEK